MPDLNSFARWLIIIGFVLVGIGAILWVMTRLDIPLGQLPGDLKIQTERFTCFVPIVSSILISLLLTLAINLILRRLR
jgi:hypothetical protein